MVSRGGRSGEAATVIDALREVERSNPERA
jgi:hypothetical protein